MANQALKELLFRMADDALIIGHRNSEWTGLGPILEEDIAFSSMAQDQIGHALAIYTILQERLGERDADALAFLRDAKDFRCCQFTEHPIGEYDFSLMRHFLFDHAHALRWEMLLGSSFEPLALLAKKLRGEIKYHVMHGNTWLKQLTNNGTEESKARMQSALNECWPLALGMFEETEGEKELAEKNIFGGENLLFEKWMNDVAPVLLECGLKIPDNAAPVLGGRKGFHTEWLQPLIEEMGSVLRSEPAGTKW